jgi:alpha-1,4-glucan:alpha-1,4-glucan 6-glycosyltransferase
LLASFLDEPFDPSPYAPVSRLFWNEFYIDPRRAPEFANSGEAQALVESSAFQSEVSALRAGDLVEYRRGMALRRPVLEALARTLFSEDSPRQVALWRWTGEHAQVGPYARFRAVTERYRKTWQHWPVAVRDTNLAQAELDPAAERYHLYVQWLAAEQLQDLKERSVGYGAGLYLDFPLGVHGGGFDVWRGRDSFVAGASVGAPPDPLNLNGQDWGFPPAHPERLREQGYEYFILSIRNHLQYAKALRIDHVMGLRRLFWIPAGFAGPDGVYVGYREREFHAILTLESWRNQAMIIGEDLGTVPPEVRQEMRRHQLYRMYVLPLTWRDDPGRVLATPPAQSLASLNTHDMPPFAAFWNDLDKPSRRQILGSLREDGFLTPGGKPGTEEVFQATLDFLAASEAKTVLVNLEDLWLETERQNLPGTYDEHPNWRRKAALSLEELDRNAAVLETLGRVDQLRKQGREDMTDNLADRLPADHQSVPSLSADDLYLFNEGSHLELYTKLGSHPTTVDGVNGVVFRVWAPNANYVSVVGDFNEWDRARNRLELAGESGIWQGFVPDVGPGAIYKYHIGSHVQGYVVDKADPFALVSEVPPKSASIVWDLSYQWGDQEWMEQRWWRNAPDAPLSIYEVHLGSWMRVPDEDNRALTYRELAPRLAQYARDMGFTHVEFMPVTEHPFYGSWGYQTTGYFAPTSRYGTPQEFMELVDVLHQHNIGVILDWVPSHFPTDEHGLAFFDGTHLYEHADPRQGFHPDWNSAIFNYGRNEVRSFLLSSALFWLDKYHIDGLRVDAVASMLYLDYSRNEGEWIPNQHGGRENLEAISFLRRLNEEVYRLFPDTQTIAEESTAWPMVSRPTYLGGLGFGMKWDMGWMHDTLRYMSEDPVHRKFHHNDLTFRLLYAFTENFVLPLSHDEVVHGKGSLLGKMPGDEWQRFANLRLLYSLMFAEPGKKLLFMGGEFGQVGEWNHDASLDWHVLAYPSHAGVQRLVKQLNRVYRASPALYERDNSWDGFEWVDANDTDQSVLSFLRKGRSGEDWVLAVFSFTPVPRHGYRLGVPAAGFWREILNTDAGEYGGSGIGNHGGVEAVPEPMHGLPNSVTITLPPLGGLYFRFDPHD